jgi:predicted protein tyrosine phosphatase
VKLLVGPLDAVGRLCAEHRPSHLVSWLAPGAAPPELGGPLAPQRRLALSSHDIAAPREGLVPPAREHLLQLIAFADAWSGAAPMLLHCWAAVSRSTAAAYAVACRKRPDLCEAELARRLRALSPEATPNPLIVRLADELLGRDGRMSAAIGAIGRGAEAALGRSFAYPLT